ncbi:hypothetical protein L4C54_23235 [Vibrio lamellibrachiae]|uniref:hypothetical protein n=1 Tax=Vibrio lamellibrachiae TaxID=2910253 RepID=UPI003D0E80AB
MTNDEIIELDIENVEDYELDTSKLPSLEAQKSIVDLIENHGYSFDEANRIVKTQ